MTGTTAAPQIAGSVMAQSLSIRQTVVGTLEARLRTEQNHLRLSDLRLRQASGEVTGVGAFRLGGSTGDASASPEELGNDDFELRLNAVRYPLRTRISVGDERRDVAGAFDGSVEVRGSYSRSRETPNDIRRDSTAGSWTALFNLTASDFRVDGSTLGLAAAEGTAAPGIWNIRALQLNGPIAKGRGRLTISPGLVDLETNFEHVDLAPALALGLPSSEIAARGSIGGTVRLAGAPHALSGMARLHADDLVLGGVALGALQLGATAGSGLFPLRAVGSAPPTSLSSIASPALPPRATTVTAIPNLPAAPDSAWTAAAIVATVSSAAEPSAASELVGWPTTVHARINGDVARALLAEAGYSLPAQVRMTRAALLRGKGQLGGQATLSDWTGNLEVEGLRFDRPPDLLFSAPHLEVTLADDRLQATAQIVSDASDLEFGAGLQLADRSLEGHLSGNVDLAALASLTPGVDAAGSVDAHLTLGGTLDAPRGDGELTISGLTLGSEGMPYNLEEGAATISMAGDMLLLEVMEASVSGGRLTGSGSLALRTLLAAARGEAAGVTEDSVADPRAAGHIDLLLEALPLTPLLARWPAAARLIDDGEVTASATLEGGGLDWRAYRGGIDVTQLRLRIGEYRLGLDSTASARLAAGVVHFDPPAVLTGAGTHLTLAGRLVLFNEPGERRGRIEGNDERSTELVATGVIGLDPLNALSPTWGIGGRATTDLRIIRGGGAGDSFALLGKVHIADGVVSPPPLRQPITRIAADLTFNGREITITDLTGETGGGSVASSGRVVLPPNERAAFSFTTRFREALLRLERDVRIVASADLQHDGTSERSRLSGQITLHEGTYRRDLEADDAILEILEAPETESDPLLATVDLDLQIDGAGDLIIENNLAEVEVSADLDVRGTLDEPVILGRSVLLEGDLLWNGNTFEIDRGTVEMNNPFVTEPVFEIRARTTVRSYSVDLTFSGSFQHGVKFSYTSTPPLSDLDLVNLLAFGEEPGSAALRERYEAAVGLQATRYLTDQYLAQVEEGAQRIFGVDRFRLAPTLVGSRTDPSARLTIGKRIARDLYVTYSRLINSGEDQLLLVEYQLSPTVRITGIRDEDGSLGVFSK